MRGVIIGTIVACAAFIGLAVFLTLNNSGSGPRIVAMNDQYTQRVSDGFWKRGAQNPHVILTEYMDFQCPSCYSAFPIVDGALKETADFVQFQARMYPITNIHDKALAAARGAEAAGRQGKFWEMYNILFTTQQDWKSQTPAQFKTTLEGYAQSLNINLNQFRQDVKDPSIDDPINRGITLANEIPIQGTPTFFVNGTPMSSFPTTSDEFVTFLKEAAALTTPPPTT